MERVSSDRFHVSHECGEGTSGRLFVLVVLANGVPLSSLDILPPPAPAFMSSTTAYGTFESSSPRHFLGFYTPITGGKSGATPSLEVFFDHPPMPAYEISGVSLAFRAIPPILTNNFLRIHRVLVNSFPYSRTPSTPLSWFLRVPGGFSSDSIPVATTHFRRL